MSGRYGYLIFFVEAKVFFDVTIVSVVVFSDLRSALQCLYCSIVVIHCRSNRWTHVKVRSELHHGL